MAVATTGITVRDLVVRYGTAPPAVDRVSLTVEPEELLLLLGPSGCGKTTLLRAVAGFVQPAAGTIHFGSEDVTRTPPHARQAGMVFQSFALWPHMTVADNVAFGLREQGLRKREINRRVEEALDSTHMKDYGRRRIDELSGGEQQRVALARALVVRPRCLLLDEPLASLDAKLRRSMRDEIRRICKAFGLTTIYVTHDQKEALAVADRVAVMQRGHILQVGTPGEVYRRPLTADVARFVGETNLVTGTVAAIDAAGIRVATAMGPLVASVPSPSSSSAAPARGDRVWISIRPECVRLVRGGGPTAEQNHLMARRTESIYLGEIAEHHLEVNGRALASYELNPQPLAADRDGEVAVHVDPADVVVLPFTDEETAP